MRFHFLLCPYRTFTDFCHNSLMLQWFIAENRDKVRPEQGDTPLSSLGLRGAFDQLAFPSLLGQVERMAQMGFWRFDVESRVVFWSPQLFVIHALPETGGAKVKQALGQIAQAHRVVLERAIHRALT